MAVGVDSAKLSHGQGIAVQAFPLRARYYLLLVFPLYLLFHGLSAFGLLNNVEGMYAEIAREMLAGGHWIIPQLNDVPYIEKPPLLYWLTAFSLQLFGMYDWAVRLVPALGGLFLFAAMFWFAAQTKGRRFALLAVFMLGTSAGFIVMSTVGMTDALLMAFFNAALLSGYIGMAQGNKPAQRVAATCLTLAILAKGFVALALFGLVLLCYVGLFQRDRWRELLRQVSDPVAIGLFLLLLLPWHIAASLSLPEFGWFYFINEHLYRFLGIREPRDYYSGSIFYHLPRLGLMFLPWILPLLGSLLKRGRGNEQDRDLKRFLWCCVLVPLAFFSVSSAKANYYTLICLPGLALLTALVAEHWLDSRNSLRLERCLWGALLFFSVAMIAAESAMLDYVHAMEPRFSARTMAREIQSSGEHLPIFFFQDYEDYSALPFYLQTTVGIVDSRSDDLRFGQHLGGGREHFITPEQFMSRSDPAWLLVLDPRQNQFQQSALAQFTGSGMKVGRATLYRFPAAPATR